MKHEMRLKPVPFAMMKSGRKRIELRLYDEKRRAIAVGDEIVFTQTESGERLTVKVLKLYKFPSFAHLYAALPLLLCGYTAETVKTAAPADMNEYYSAEEQARYGVLGIEITVE